MRELVIENFNQQHLILVRHAALQFERNLELVKREMLLLDKHGFLRDPDLPLLARQINLSYSRLVDDGVVAVRYCDAASGVVHRTDASGYGMIPAAQEDLRLFASAEALKYPQIFNFSSSASTEPDGRYRQFLTIAKPVQSLTEPAPKRSARRLCAAF